jgi:hypothetical protein
MSGAPPFTPATAPRQGGRPGRKVKLTAEAMRVLEKLLEDWRRHGSKTLRVLRLENPTAYARLAIETAAKLTLAESEIDSGAPMMLVVKWGTRDPSRPMPLPAEPTREFSPVSPSSPPPAPASPQNAPRLLTLLPRPDAPA